MVSPIQHRKFVIHPILAKRSLWLVLFLVLVFVFSQPSIAHAQWHEAAGEHFVVYANQSLKNVKRYTEKLERFHAAMGSVFQTPTVPPSPSNRVTVYVVHGSYRVKKLYGEGASKYLNGFYKARAGNSIAILPKISSKSKGDVSRSEQTLLHEYAHHFMYSNTESLIPRWYSEGFAEFYATAKFDTDGSVGLGLPARHRSWELGQAHMVPIEELLDAELYFRNKSKQYDNFYGRSWLLYHYLFFDQQRRPQVKEYFDRLQAGEPELEAAQRSFGSLEKLNKELSAYQHRKRLSYIKLASNDLPIEPVVVRKLSEAEAHMLPVVMVSRLGVSRQEALELLPRAREVATEYPNSEFVLAALAEAEVDAGNLDEAIAAADSAIALDPGSVRAHMQKGYALANRAAQIGQTDGGSEQEASENGQRAAVSPEVSAAQDAAWSVARQQFMKANRLEPENPLPLVHFYRSYLRQGIEPTDNSVAGLEWALTLAPFDRSVRWLVAKHQMGEARYADVCDTLVPLAFGPHQRKDNAALVMLRQAEAQLVKIDSGETKASDPAGSSSTPDT